MTKQKGVVTTHVSTIKVAQDSSRRIYRESHPMVPIDGSPGAPDPFSVSVSDPQRQIDITWNESGEAVVHHLPEQSHPSLPARQPVAPESDCPKLLSTPPPASEPYETDLETRIILGMEATGRRFKVVTPAQPDTHKAADTAIEESWFSSDYHVEVLRIVKYANGGYVKSEIVSFEEGEPDPTIFEVPEGYAVRDGYQDTSPPVWNR